MCGQIIGDVPCEWCGEEGGGIENDGSIASRTPPEEERIKRNLSGGEEVSSFLVRT